MPRGPLVCRNYQSSRPFVELPSCVLHTAVLPLVIRNYPRTVDLGKQGSYFSTDPEKNPMYNWHLAYFKYCDGASRLRPSNML
jgi:hypothetical protein